MGQRLCPVFTSQPRFSLLMVLISSAELLGSKAAWATQQFIKVLVAPGDWPEDKHVCCRPGRDPEDSPLQGVQSTARSTWLCVGAGLGEWEGQNAESALHGCSSLI